MRGNTDKRYANTFYRVEATTYEVLTIIGRYDDCYRWKQDHFGTLETVGRLDSRPIVITCQWYEIHDRLVMFWEATSEVVDYKLIEEWFNTHCPCPSTNAMNFHNCIREIERLSKQ